MRIIVLGAGVAGITAAYALGNRGHRVEVIERESGPALATSYANGGQLSYTHALPWANAETLPKVFKWMFRDDAPLVMRLSTDPHMIRWGLTFLRNCTTRQAERGTITMLRLGLYSRQKLADIRAQTKIEFHHATKGILHVFSEQASLDGAIRQSKFQETYGGAEELLTREQCVAREPALKEARKPIIGGLYSELDESGDLHLFTQRLSEYCQAQFGATLHYGEEIVRIEAEGGRVTGVVTKDGTKTADAYVMALGPQSPLLLRPIGVKAPIYPMKGYSVTIPTWNGAPEVSITDDEKKVVISRLGDRIRAAGTAEFARYDTSIREKRITPILRCIADLFPAADLANPKKWACLRPQTPDGPPIVGRTGLANLFMHTGHGTLGWTQSPGTAQLLADIMEERPTEIETDDLSLRRFSA